MSEYIYPGYIKTDDIVKYCDEQARVYELTNPSYSDACSDIGNKCLDLSNDINELSFAEIVRCKDCIRYIEPYCTRFITAMVPMNENDFCSKGERKETE